MKEQVKNLYLKALLIGIKGIIVLPLIVFLIYEAFITQNQEAENVACSVCCCHNNIMLDFSLWYICLTTN